jgi:hypothetical protein
MTAFPSYSTGTVAIAANATSVVGTGSNWTGVNAMPGDLLVVGPNTVIVQDVTDATHLAIDAWPFAAVSAGTAYKLYKVSPLRFVGAQTAIQVDRMVTALDVNGFYVFVPPDASVPDPSLGQDSQYAFQATTGKLWQKVGGTWNFIGVFKGFGLPAAWNSATAYVAFDVVTLAGTSYVCILANTNQTPPNATYWTVLAAKGDTGSQGIQGAGYACTSATSFAIGTGSKAFTTQAGLAWLPGARARISSLAGGGANYMEGVVTAYSGTTLTVNVSKATGSGTDADWQISLAGDPGSGDLLSTNNLSDISNKTTALNNLSGVSYGAAQSLTASQRTQARANIASTLKGHLFGCTLSTAGASANFGITAGEWADSTSVDLMALPSAYTKTTGAWAVGSGNGSLDVGTIAIGTTYFPHLIKRTDTNVVDILTSLAPGTSSAVTISNASPGVIGWINHGLQANAPVMLSTTGALPTGLTAATQYFVKTVVDVNNFTVSATQGGAAINTSSAGSGTHTAVSNPILPANYTLFRRIGSLQVDASSHWVLFTQVGDKFIYGTSFTDINNAFLTATRSIATLSVPTGFPVEALFRAVGNPSTAGNIVYTSLYEADQAPNTGTFSDIVMLGASDFAAGNFARLTNPSGQIGYRADVTTLHHTISTYGFNDSRGRLG